MESILTIMNKNIDRFYCPIRGCSQSRDGETSPFPTQTTLLRHLNSSAHDSTHHLANHTQCTAAGSFTCCHTSCPSSSKKSFRYAAPSTTIVPLSVHHQYPPLLTQTSNQHPPLPRTVATYDDSPFSSGTPTNMLTSF